MTPPRKSKPASGKPVHVEGHANSVVGLSLRHLLRQSGINVAPEVKGMGGAKPDIYIEAGNHSIVIEAKYGDRKAAADAARARFAEMNPPPHIVGALSYSKPFETDPEKAAREGAPVDFAFTGHNPDDKSAAELDPAKWRPVWHTGSIYDVAQVLRRPRAVVDPQADEMAEAVGAINGALASFQNYFRDKPGSIRHIAKALKVNLDDSRGEEREALENEALRVAGLILIGAMMFQFALAEQDDRVRKPTDFLSAVELPKLPTHWEFILDEINYAAIFNAALDVMRASDPHPILARTLAGAAQTARGITQGGADLTGQVYHRVLADAKTLAAFYTSIPAATMMSRIALDMNSQGAEKWADLDFIRNLRVADPACGSGTLLTAAAWQIRDNFLRADFRKHGAAISEDARDRISELHRAMLEEIMWGYDILETAAHLTAANLGLMSPGVDFRKAHIYRTIIGKAGGNSVGAGSLEMLDSDVPIFERGDRQVETRKEAAALPALDLCIMNPPFVRGTAGNESFNFLPPGEQKAVRTRMVNLGKQFGFSCDKGQGPGFVALACKRVKPGGRVAMILPSTLATGMGRAWAGSRENLERDFNLETLIVSRDSARPNFSMNTNFQECVCVARKRRNGEKPSNKALFVSLRRNPSTGDDGLAAARVILRAEKDGRDLGDLDEGFGQFARLSWHGKSAWRGVSFANLHLAFVAENFFGNGSLLPYVTGKASALKPLGELADFGGHTLDLRINHPDVKFLRISETETVYAGYYPGYHRKKTGIGHKDSADIQESPHCWLAPMPNCEKKAEDYFAKAGRLAINQSFGFHTARRLAALISHPVQASHYWPVRLRKETEARLKALTVWINSTPSILLIAHTCSSTNGTKVNFSQAAAKELPVPDLDALTSAQFGKLTEGFDAVVAAANRGEGLLPMPMMVQDPTRKLLDDAVSNALGLGDLHPLRAALANEPIIVSRPAGED